MKKLLLFLIALIALSAQTWAYDFSYTYQGQTLYYYIVDGNAQVTYQTYQDYSPSYTNLTGSLTIPSSVTYNGTTYSVTSIGEYAFRNCSGLTSVTIPNSVTSIDGAFFNCSGLTSLTIPNSVTSIGNYAFQLCSSLTSVTIGNSVTSIGSSAFSGCTGLTSVTIPNSVTSIGEHAFYQCTGLTGTLTIPNSVTSIGSSAFSGCTGLTSVTIPNSVTSIGSSAFSGCTGLTSVTIGNSVTSIGSSAFSGCSGLESIIVESGNTVYDSRNNCNAIIETSTNTLILGCKNTVIPNSVTSISGYAFADCSGLTSVTIPNSVTSIGEVAFYGCSGLTSVTIGNSVTYIGSSAFYGCTGLESIIVGSGNTVYDSRNNCNAIIETSTNTLISGCKNTIIPNSVTYIGPGAFSGCSGLTSVTIPNSVTYIGEWAFRNCSGLTTVNFNATNCTTMGNSDYPVFYECTALATLNIGDNVTNIPNYAFYHCSSLTSVTIGNSVTSIGSSAFSGCSGLTSLTIPNSVTSIGSSAFYNCSGFTEIHSLNSVPPTAYSNTFGGVPTNTPVYIPCGRLSYYTAADGWSRFTNFIESSAASFSAVSNNNAMGSVQILTMPTCTNPQAVVYAVANSGYQFDHWSDNSTSNPYSLTVNEDMELTAYFSPIGSQPTTYYTITVSANDAEMGTVTGGGSFADGTTTTITATANSGYHFVQWQDGNTEASRSITVTADAEYTAYFAANGANDYTITVMAQNPSMGTTTGSGTFAYGTATTITAEPYEGYYFVQWNDGNTQRIRTITVTGNATYTAYFDRSNGIDDITAEEVEVFARGSEIVIEGCENGDVLVYDIMGRIVYKDRIEAPIHVNAMGVYMVKIGDRQPQKVVVR